MGRLSTWYFESWRDGMVYMHTTPSFTFASALNDRASCVLVLLHQVVQVRQARSTSPRRERLCEEDLDDDEECKRPSGTICVF